MDEHRMLIMPFDIVASGSASGMALAQRPETHMKYLHNFGKEV